MTLQIHFTENDWDRIERDWTAWWAGELDRPLAVVESWSPTVTERPPAPHPFTSTYPLEMPEDEVLDHYQACLENIRFLGDAWPKWYPNYGPGAAAGFLGAHVEPLPETVWFEPSELIPIQELRPTYSPDNIWWRRVRALTRRAVERWGDRICIGHTDIGGNLDILASLLTTEQLLLDCCDAPAEVVRLVGEITRLWARYYDEIHEIVQPGGHGTSPWASIWSPGRCYMLQCDFSYMISPAMFERFVLPDIVACCEILDHGFYHLDGKGQIPHLDMLLSVDRLRGIQWIPGDGAPPPEEWLELLSRIRDAGKLCQLYVSPEGALTITRALGGRGFVFAIDDRMEHNEATDFLNVLASEAKSR